MPRLAQLFGLGLVLAAGASAWAQSPSPSPAGKASPADSQPAKPASPAPSASATAKPAASPAPSAPMRAEELINSLAPADIQSAISLLKSNYTKPDAINEAELNRAMLQGLLVRLGHGLMLLPDKGSVNVDVPAPFYGEIVDGHVGYLRLGTLNAANLAAMDKKLADFAAKKVDALAIDLRSSSGNDFNVGADFAKRFTAKGKPLFSLRKQGKQDRSFTSDRDPAYQGLITLLGDNDTVGAAEALAAALRLQDKALLIGDTTAGQAAEYSDMPLPSGKILRVAIAEAVASDGKSLFPDGLKPDLPVEMPAVEKRQIFQMSMEKGLVPFVTETERPHLNEAALIAGTNPELESSEQRRGRNQDRYPHDAVLQRALDLVTSLEVYQKR